MNILYFFRVVFVLACIVFTFSLTGRANSYELSVISDIDQELLLEDLLEDEKAIWLLLEAAERKKQEMAKEMTKEMALFKPLADPAESPKDYYSMSHILSYLHDLFSSFTQGALAYDPDQQLKQAFDEMVEEAGIAILGESAYLLTGPYSEEAKVDHYGDHDISDKVRVSFINGILNTRKKMDDGLKLISDSHGGVKVHYVYFPSRGWTWDISRGILIRTAYQFGYRSMNTYLLADLWRDLIAEMEGVDGGGVIIHYAHSLGGSETDRARDLLTPEEQKMIRVITFGSSTLVRNQGFKEVINHVSTRDGVSSFFLEPLGHIRNYFDPNSNVRFYTLPDAPYWPRDHLLNGVTYSMLMKQCGKEFLEEYAR